MKQLSPKCFIGTAGWGIPLSAAEFFSASGTHLYRYSQRLNAVEINSSLYRDQQAETYQKWAEATPAHFRFSVKLSHVFTHDKILQWEPGEFVKTLNAIMHLGDKLQVLLVQFPAQQVMQKAAADTFFASLRRIYQGDLLCDMHHRSWLSAEGLALLKRHAAIKVHSDPDSSYQADEDAKAPLVYFRLYGTPDIYESGYSFKEIKHIAHQLLKAADEGKSCWCIFENTKFGKATHNALELAQILHESPHSSSMYTASDLLI